MNKLYGTIRAIAFCGAIALTAACAEDINLPASDDSDYVDNTQSLGYLTHMHLSGTEVDVDLREASITRSISLNLTRPNAEGMTIQVEPVSDRAVIDAYNMEHNTNYTGFPTELVTLSNHGELTVEPWKKTSEPITITLAKNVDVAPEGGEYILPVRVKDDAALVLANEQTLWFRVTVAKKMVISPRDVHPIACVQINGTNPLNAGLYTLTESGEPFFSQVTLFAANINWDVQRKKAYLTFNENLTPLLAQRNKYIKPLQDKGIKVTLSLLGNRDGVCFRNYTKQGALDFALEVKSVIEAYGLDGVFMDEEYMNYGSNNLPGQNSTSWGYLCYYLKQLMPDKLVTIYNYDIGSDFRGTTEGQPTGNFVDYAMQYSSDTWSSTGYTAFNGLTKRQWGPWSQIIYDDYQSNNYGGGRPSLNDLRAATRQNYLRQVKDEYGVIFFYNLAAFCDDNPNYTRNAAVDFGPNGFDANTRAYNYSDYFTEFSKVLFGEDVFRDGMPLAKDY